MSKVGKTPKLVVATPQGNTLGSNRKLAQAVLKEEKEKAVELSFIRDKDDDRDTLIRRIPKL